MIQMLWLMTNGLFNRYPKYDLIPKIFAKMNCLWVLICINVHFMIWFESTFSNLEDNTQLLHPRNLPRGFPRNLLLMLVYYKCRYFHWLITTGISYLSVSLFSAIDIQPCSYFVLKFLSCIKTPCRSKFQFLLIWFILILIISINLKINLIGTSEL